jgi:predicted glutamine amidotransferase
MCELLGMSCNTPTDIVFSFQGFTQRGGKTGEHKDGWGLVLYEGPAVRTFREPDPAAHSALADFLRANPTKTLLAVAHIRKRTRGLNALKNTHPFTRELWGRTMTFAHNGTVKRRRDTKLERFAPLGTTDSEWAFCAMLDHLQRRFKAAPSDKALSRAVAEVAHDLADRGTFNFLLSDGKRLYARCHTNLAFVVRKHPFSKATLCDSDVCIDFSAVTTKRDRVAVIATKPLTKDEAWTTGKNGDLWVFEAGEHVQTLKA